MSIPSIQWVHSSGNDSDAGTEDAPKLTVVAAYDALPAAGGTIICSGDLVDLGEPLWLIGPTDPNVASPPAGWRPQKRLHLTSRGGMSGAFVETPTTLINCTGATVGVWFAGTNIPITLENVDLLYPAIAIRIGVASDLSHRHAVVSGVRFVNVGAQIHQALGNGPCIDIGWAFWIWFDHCHIAGNETEPLESDRRCSILVKPDPNQAASNQLYVRDCIFTRGGGFRYYVGTTTSWDFSVDTTIIEGDFVNPAQPVVEIRGANRFGRAYLEGLTIADAPGTEAAVVVQTEAYPREVAGAVVCIGCANVIGPATIMGTYPATMRDATESPLARGQLGISQGILLGQHDGARRTFGPVAVRFPNLAPHDTTTWSSKYGGATVTTGQPAPNGTTNAALLTSASGLTGRDIYRSPRTLAVGDAMIIGAWVQGTLTSAPLSMICTLAVGTHTFDDGLNYFTADPAIAGDGEWQWIAAYRTITSVSGGNEVIAEVRCSDTQPTTWFGPIFLHIPAGSLSANELAEFTQHLQTYPEDAPVGTVAMLAGNSLWPAQVEPEPITEPRIGNPTLVTLAEFKRQLGVSGLPTDDALLTMKLEQATALVLEYIRRSDDADQAALIEGWGSEHGSPAQEPVPAHVQAAILQWGTELYTDRGDDPTLAQAREHPGDPSAAVKAMLHRDGRRPVFA